MTGGPPGSFDPFRPPLIGAWVWEETMTAAQWRCECAGQCGRPHTKTKGRCGTIHGTAHRLAVVAADPLATLTAAVTATERVALCATCETGVRRTAEAARTTTEPAQPDLFDTTGIEAA
ncbi:hypothetical protein [Kribbella pratensis]|uniref:Uncharacterized protein n=1 Tax=Kribbella pratensis TaxID=2512112 RepID=A0A4R8BV29_9ACTN|nr:hypothetical protein [Kribbella pratensis]TDW65618.1 hypothetical protein EV653_5629 [Kribbella pratensis]